MKTILQDLYYGNLNPSGKAFLPDSPYGRLVNDLTETEEKLLPLLTSTTWISSPSPARNPSLTESAWGRA